MSACSRLRSRHLNGAGSRGQRHALPKARVTLVFPLQAETATTTTATLTVIPGAAHPDLKERAALPVHVGRAGVGLHSCFSPTAFMGRFLNKSVCPLGWEQVRGAQERRETDSEAGRCLVTVRAGMGFSDASRGHHSIPLFMNLKPRRREGRELRPFGPGRRTVNPIARMEGLKSEGDFCHM